MTIITTVTAVLITVGNVVPRTCLAIAAGRIGTRSRATVLPSIKNIASLAMDSAVTPGIAVGVA